jgi:hypothetical protein
VITILHQVWDFIWYGLLFESKWLSAIGKTVEDMDPGNPVHFVFSIIGSFLITFAMASIFKALSIDTPPKGLRYGFLIWLSFFFFPYATHQQFIGFGFDLLLVDGGKELIAFLFTGLILTVWKKYETDSASA